ncbi:MAG: hypothetical protein BGO95_03435 [Micrococcales bacterium 73-13]|nr:MAG: hypothetical protein BGO95_03435 [Micrococcales bacterium 73-13]
MPRTNRRREEEAPPLDAERILSGARRTVAARDGEWTVQPMAASNSVKAYACPGCSGTIEPGTAHLVVWRADSILGDADALAQRRHWHRRCWEIRA